VLAMEGALLERPDPGSLSVPSAGVVSLLEALIPVVRFSSKQPPARWSLWLQSLPPLQRVSSEEVGIGGGCLPPSCPRHPPPFSLFRNFFSGKPSFWEFTAPGQGDRAAVTFVPPPERRGWIVPGPPPPVLGSNRRCGRSPLLKPFCGRVPFPALRAPTDGL